MNGHTRVTKDVVKDLLPLYQEGELSQDSRLLVEEFLAKDPELRDQVAAASATPNRKIDVRSEVDQSLATMERTKRVLRKQKWLQFFAVLFSVIPFSFLIKDGELKYFLPRDAPLSLIPIWGAALVFWLCYWRSRQVGSSIPRA